VTVAAGVNKEFGHGLGVVSADFNDDGWSDILKTQLSRIENPDRRGRQSGPSHLPGFRQH